jgi:hypothetical protein
LSDRKGVEMTRQLEQEIEDKARRERLELIGAVFGGLDAAIESAGGELQGFSAKLSGGDCLLTLRADFADGSKICFVGANDFPDAMRKSVRELKGGQAQWREDRYASR